MQCQVGSDMPETQAGKQAEKWIYCGKTLLLSMKMSQSATRSVSFLWPVVTIHKALSSVCLCIRWIMSSSSVQLNRLGLFYGITADPLSQCISALTFQFLHTNKYQQGLELIVCHQDWPKNVRFQTYFCCHDPNLHQLKCTPELMYTLMCLLPLTFSASDPLSHFFFFIIICTLVRIHYIRNKWDFKPFVINMGRRATCFH